jgi:hypothetical protein
MISTWKITLLLMLTAGAAVFAFFWALATPDAWLY